MFSSIAKDLTELSHQMLLITDFLRKLFFWTLLMWLVCLIAAIFCQVSLQRKLRQRVVLKILFLEPPSLVRSAWALASLCVNCWIIMDVFSGSIYKLTKIKIYEGVKHSKCLHLLCSIKMAHWVYKCSEKRRVMKTTLINKPRSIKNNNQ